MPKLKTVLHYKYFYLILLIIASIYVLYQTKLKHYESRYDINTTYFTGIVMDKKIDGNNLSATIKGKELLKLTYYFTSLEEKNYYLANLDYGSVVKITGKLSIPSKNSVPNTFNYQEYLYNHQIYYVLNASKITIEENTNIFYKLKNYVTKRINQNTNSAYLQTFILGNKNYLEEETLNNFKTNGVSHLFAISGMHLSFFAVFLTYLLTKLKIKGKFQRIIIILVLLFYSFMANFTPSITRALIFYIILSINKEFNFEVKSLNLLILTFVIMVFLNPFYLYDIGFIYSFTTTFIIIYISKKIEGLSSFKKTFYLSLICFLGSAPITLANFYEINFLSIIANIILTPLISMIIYPLSLLSLILPVSCILTIFLMILDGLNNLLASITLFKIIAPLPFYLLIFYYLVFYLFIRNLDFKYIGGLVLVLIMAVIIPKLDSRAYIYYLDVDQGDSSLIVSPYKKEVILIDTGGKVEFKKEEWEERSKKYYLSDNTITLLKSMGISKIDDLILTHGDFDHMGEAKYLVNNFKVDKVIFNSDSFNDLETELVNVLQKKKIKYSNKVNNIKINKSNLLFLNTELYDNENDNSNVIYFNLYNYKFLFMGDAGVKREDAILDRYVIKNINFLKVGHHGSNTSSGKHFINAIHPQISLISVGKKNRYGHPSEEVLDNLSASKVYRTDTNGTIEVKLNKKSLLLKTYTA